MLRLNDLNASHFRILVCLPLILGLWPIIVPAPALHISEVWPDGPATIVVHRNDSNDLVVTDIEEHHKISANRVVINEADQEQLMACPGIGSKTAVLILKERAFGRFYDWRDLETRVKGIGKVTIEKLIDAGVKLNREVPPENQ